MCPVVSRRHGLSEPGAGSRHPCVRVRNFSVAGRISTGRPLRIGILLRREFPVRGLLAAPGDSRYHDGIPFRLTARRGHRLPVQPALREKPLACRRPAPVLPARRARHRRGIDRQRRLQEPVRPGAAEPGGGIRWDPRLHAGLRPQQRMPKELFVLVGRSRGGLLLDRARVRVRAPQPQGAGAVGRVRRRRITGADRIGRSFPVRHHRFVLRDAPRGRRASLLLETGTRHGGPVV